MLWITLFFALLIALGALGFVIWPMVGQDLPLLPLEDDRLADLLARKDNALRSLKDLEFDHQVGKISDVDYQRFNERLSRQAVGLLQQIERITPEGTQLDEQLEAEIAKLRRVQATTRVVLAAEPAPSIVAVAEKQVRHEVAVANQEPSTGGTAHFCTECGVRIDPTFKFCANCGAPVARLAAQQVG